MVYLYGFSKEDIAMAIEFVGSGKRLKDKDFEEAAAQIGCEIAAVKTVADVESAGGGFLKDKRPKILFESHWFGRLTDHRFDKSHPDISTARWVGGYAGGSKEYKRLEKAMDLDEEAALKSASWGKFQILGVNHKLAGFSTVQDFVKAHVKSEGEHLRAFVNFIRSKKLDDELRDLRWADFAAVYNGPAYRKNRYDEKMAAAYAEHAGELVAPSTADVQRALNRHGFSLTVDGRTGPKTRAAIMHFQSEHGLVADGIAGAQTLAALDLAPVADPIAVARRMG